MSDFRPFCIPCGCRMEVRKNQVYLVHPKDYVQEADLYECPNCHHQVLNRFGEPILAICQEDYAYVAKMTAKISTSNHIYQA